MNEPVINAKIAAIQAMLSAMCAIHPDRDQLRSAYMAVVQNMRDYLPRQGFEPQFVALVEEQFDSMLTMCRLA
jgi:hypothetical protein